MTKKQTLAWNIIAAAVGCVLAAAAARAQDAPPSPPEAPAEGTVLEEVIVTAQKRQESVQDVPLSIQAFSASTLEAAGIVSVTDLPRLVPNLNILRGSQTANVRVNIRGIGAAGNTAVDPSVGTFVDGIYVPRPGALFAAFNDMAGAEVLRGPQGTLFGRNSTVGAILLRTASPDDELDASFTAGAGSYGSRKFTEMLNFGVGDKLAFRFAGLSESTDGYIENRLDGKTWGERETLALRAGMKADITDALSWTLKVDYSQISGDGTQEYEILPETVTATARARMTAAFGGVTPDLEDAFDRKSNQSFLGDLDDEQWGLASDLSWDIAGGNTLRLLSGFRHWENEQLDGDTVFAPREFVSRIGAYDSKSQSHELQLISPVDELIGGRFDYVAGLYYFQEDFFIGEILGLRNDFCRYLVGAAQRPACNASANKDTATDLDFNQDAQNYAVYAQGNFKVTDTVRLTAGARWTQDDKDATFVQLRNNPFAAALRAPENTTLTNSDDQFTYRLGAEWRPLDDVMTFVSYSTGYKSGGFNSGGGTTNLGQRRLFDKETSENIELGAKSTLFDGRMRLNGTLFRMDLSDFQDRAFDGVSFNVVNAGNLRHQGIELDTDFAVTDGFQLYGALGYLDSEFTEYDNASCLPYPAQITPTCTQDLKGERANFAPEWTGNLGVQFQGDIGSSGVGYMLRTDASYTGEANWNSVNDGNPQGIQDSRTLVSARFSLLFGDHWTLSLFGDNLLDEGYCLAMSATPLDSNLGLRDPVTGGTVMRCNVAPPRTWGLEIKAKL